MLRLGSLLGETPREVLTFFPIETTLFLAQGRPKVNINRDFLSLSRLRYFYGGHVSNDVIIMTIVKPQMGWEWLI